MLGDQLTDTLSALTEANPARDTVVMAEVMGEAASVPHHPKKIAFLFSAMRKHAARLRMQGWRVAYTKLDDPANTQTIPGELLRRAAEHGPTEVIATQPGEWRLIQALEDMPLPVHQFADRRFIAPPGLFETWAAGRGQLRMEYFYRDMRRLTGLLMEGEKPAGGKWNHDADNRKPPPAIIDYPGPLHFTPDEIVTDVLSLIGSRFAEAFGDLHPFWFATDPVQAQAHFDHWLTHGLPGFGDTQDAMLAGNGFMNHAVIGLYLNAGLLDPLAVCQAVDAEYRAGRVAINAAEGFIRQIIGWREYMRGIWHHEGPDYARRNALNHTRPLPAFFWGAPTRMACVGAAVRQTREQAYAHHIQRLMVTGNFALLAGIDPFPVHEWYLSVYADAYEWVETPNVIGMSQFADGGIVASKPYVSSGAYIDRMSDYCGGCAHDVKARTGATACPFNLLYWDFVARHADRFRTNPRMAQIVRSWDRMEKDRKAVIRAEAAAFLVRMDAGETV